MIKYKSKQCLICKKEYLPCSSHTKVCDQCKKRKCLVCGKEFYLIKLSPNYLKSKRGIYCSRQCYLNARWTVKNRKCIICKKKLKENQLRYCSEKCIIEGIRLSYRKNSLKDKRKFWQEKINLLKELGGKCKICGNSDIRVLDINHKDRSKKFRLKGKGLHSWGRRFKDWKENKGNLEILCANCHRIKTWEQMNYGNY